MHPVVLIFHGQCLGMDQAVGLLRSGALSSGADIRVGSQGKFEIIGRP